MAAKTDAGTRGKRIAAVCLIAALVLIVASRKNPWQVKKYDAWSRTRIELFRDYILQGRQLVSQSPDKYDYNRLREIRNKTRVLINTSDDLPFSISGNKDIVALHGEFAEGMKTLPIHFSMEDIKQPVPDLPPELHQKYVTSMGHFTTWLQGFEALKQKEGIRGRHWEPADLLPY